MEHFSLQPVTMDDKETAMKLICEAKRFLGSQGIDQWQAGYPDETSIREDIENQRGYFIADGKLKAAYLCIDFKGEPAYNTLNGRWKSSRPYAVIHRLAIAEAYRGKGLSRTVFQLAEALCKEKNISSIRVDTDEKNLIMRHVITRNGFEYCGTVWFQNSSKQAYEKIIVSSDTDDKKLT